jgi:hypothetical protein
MTGRIDRHPRLGRINVGHREDLVWFEVTGG